MDWKTIAFIAVLAVACTLQNSALVTSIKMGTRKGALIVSHGSCSGDQFGQQGRE